MKRELKFRVWNGMEMVYDVTVGKFGAFYVNPEKGDGLNPNDSASLTPNTTKYHEINPIMQFTGLLDKNGKEIYEDDIVQISNGKIMRIEWGHAVWNIHYYANMGETKREVIGNYYQHSNLMSGSNAV